ncbi:MAG: hypothetical protein DMF64_06070 [Acidobacteria bacterium]|nr:MAG: hypothetical protein DMF64_06070 [Acidobacteriota bacterium]
MEEAVMSLTSSDSLATLPPQVQTATSPPNTQAVAPKPSIAPTAPPAPSYTYPAIDISSAKPYTIIAAKDTSVGNRKRKEIKIISSAASRDERAHTAMKAAIETQQQFGLDFVEVWLEPSPLIMGAGYQYAIARYAPDGQGYSPPQQLTWEVQASDQQVSKQAPAIGELWFQNRDSFQTSDGLTDEPRLEAFISKKLGIPKAQVNLDQLQLIILTRKPYPPNFK